MAKTFRRRFLPARTIGASWLIVFVVKLLFAYAYCNLIFVQRPERRLGNISYASGDFNSYIGAMENYIQKGQYFFINQLGDTVRAGRPPHFALPYLVARQFTGEENSTDFLSIFNIAIESFAILCMAIMAAYLSPYPRIAYYAALILGMVSAYVSNWAFITLPDCTGASLFMIGLYFFWRAYKPIGNLKANILLASFFFSWAAMLRPFLLIIIIALAIIFLVRRKFSFREYRSIALMAMIPLLIFLLPWAVRNYKVTGRLAPFQQDIYAGYGYRPSELQARRLMTTMGEDGGTFWDPTAMASYFSPERFRSSTFQYPGYVKKDSDYLSQLESTRYDYISGFYTRSPEEEAKMVKNVASLRKDYIRKYPLRYYIINPLRRTIKFWGHSGSYYISAEKANKEVISVTKFVQSVLYFSVLILGTIGLIKMGRRNEIGWMLLLPLIILTVMFPMVFGFMEPRYAIAFYYPGIIGLVFILSPLMKRVAPHSGVDWAGHLEAVPGNT